MTDSAFANRLREQVQELLGTGVRVTLCHSPGGEEKTGLMFQGEQDIARPVLYLETFCGEKEEDSLEELARKIALWYADTLDQERMPCAFPIEYSSARNSLVVKLLGKKEAEKLPEQVVSQKYLDFVMVFDLLLAMQEETCVTCRIRREHLEKWNIDIKRLFFDAEAATRRKFPALFQTMEEVIASLVNCAAIPVKEQIYVLTNERKYWGAATLLYKGCLEEIGNRLQEDYYVIPSSVHEVILLPVSRAPACDRINQMIQEVNETQLKEEEVLGDTAYYYDRVKKELRKAGSDAEKGGTIETDNHMEN